MSRSRLNKNNRRVGALERRKEDIKAHESRLKEFRAVKIVDQETVNFYTAKLNKAVEEVKILEGKVTKN